MAAPSDLSGEEFRDILRSLFGRRALQAYREGTGISRTQIYRWTKAAKVPQQAATTVELPCFLRAFGCPIPGAFGPLASCGVTNQRGGDPVVLRYPAGTPVSRIAVDVASAIAEHR